MSSGNHYDAFLKALWCFTKDIIMLYRRHHNEFFLVFRQVKKSLPDDIKKSSQWFGNDIAMIFQQHRDVLLKTSQWIFLERTLPLSPAPIFRLKADWKVILSVIAIYTQAVTSRLKAERRDKKDNCIGGLRKHRRCLSLITPVQAKRSPGVGEASSSSQLRSELNYSVVQTGSSVPTPGCASLAPGLSTFNALRHRL
jgi:hypothetical protein